MIRLPQIGEKYKSFDVTLIIGGIMKVIDPVCKMELEEKDVKFKSEYKGKTYYFCALSDKRKFDENPEKFIEQ